MLKLTRNNLFTHIPDSAMKWAGIVNVQTAVQPVYRDMYVGDTYNKVRYLYPQDIIDLMEKRIHSARHLNSVGAYLPMWELMAKQCKELIDVSS